MTNPLRLISDATLGTIETAKIICHDYRNAAANTTQLAQLQNEKNRSEHSDAFIINSVLKSFNEARNSTKNTLGIISEDDNTATTYDGAVPRIYTVQFNPSKLTINASSVPILKKDAISGLTEESFPVTPDLKMTTYLHFDAMRTSDAFLWEKYKNVSLSNTPGALYHEALQRKHDNANAKIAENGDSTFARLSVQPYVEGFIAALRNPYTRSVSFRWADFSFTGTIEAITAKYTMFSPEGHPVRAQVMLRLHHEISDAALRPWLQNFNTVFNENKAQNLVKYDQYVSSILNIGI